MHASDASDEPTSHESVGAANSSSTEVDSASNDDGTQSVGTSGFTLNDPSRGELQAVLVNGSSPSGEVTSPTTASIDDESSESKTPRTFGLSHGDLIFVSVMLTAILILTVYQLVHRHGWHPTEIEVLHPANDYRFTIEINTATWVEWLHLDGIGETLARRIVEHRERHGPFQSIEDLDDVDGIGPATLDKMRPHLRCEPSSGESR